MLIHKHFKYLSALQGFSGSVSIHKTPEMAQYYGLKPRRFP